jgi:hypothetical protein
MTSKLEAAGIELGNGEERATAHPATFHIPSKAAREDLRPGDCVKLLFRRDNMGERMWVEVLARAVEGYYIGELDNDPFVFVGLLKDRDTIHFRSEHVLSIIRRGNDDPD